MLLMNLSSMTKYQIMTIFRLLFNGALLISSFPQFSLIQQSKNTAIQPLLDGVCEYFPDPSESEVWAHDANLPTTAPPPLMHASCLTESRC